MRCALAAALLSLAVAVPRHETTFANPVSALPLTTSGIHLGMEFNYKEPTVNGYKTQEGNVDYVLGADGDLHNVPARFGHPFHDKYLSWSRDASGHGAQEPVSWYERYHPDWLLYQSNRTTIPLMFGDNVAPLDFTNPAVQQYVVTHWIDRALVGGFQGITFDNDMGFNYLRAAGHYDAHGNWVQLYTGNWTDPTYATAQVAAFQNIVAVVHASYPSATIGMNQGVDCDDNLEFSQAGQQYANIIIDQAGFTNAANNSLPYVAQYTNQFCPDGKWLTVAQWAQHVGRDWGDGLFLINPEPYAVTTDMTDSNSQARFDLQWALANYLLVKYAHTYLWWGSWAQQAGYPPVMQREYTTAQAIGSPTTDFYASQNVYMRNFSNGLAVVNPALSTSYTVALPAGRYQDLYGHAITTYTMPPHSGLVLLAGPRIVTTSTPLPAAAATATSAPSLTATPTATPVPPTTTPPPTPIQPPAGTPVPTRTPVPPRPTPGLTHPRGGKLTIDRVEILHRVRSRMVNTRVLVRGETATFIVMYHVRPPRSSRPTATLLITSQGKIVRLISLEGRTVFGRPAFARTISLGRALSGRFWTHFLLHIGSVYAERDRKLTITPGQHRQ